MAGNLAVFQTAFFKFFVNSGTLDFLSHFKSIYSIQEAFIYISLENKIQIVLYLYLFSIQEAVVVSCFIYRKL